MVYRQRTTAIDDFLLRIVFPWLVALHATPILRLARIWSEPVHFSTTTPPPGRPNTDERSNPSRWNFASLIDGTFRPVKQ
jgi:hypothetical protein